MAFVQPLEIRESLNVVTSLVLQIMRDNKIIVLIILVKFIKKAHTKV
jgi:hypothetical protein